jgi:hypothetical protein
MFNQQLETYVPDEKTKYITRKREFHYYQK